MSAYQFRCIHDIVDIQGSEGIVEICWTAARHACPERAVDGLGVWRERGRTTSSARWENEGTKRLAGVHIRWRRSRLRGKFHEAKAVVGGRVVHSHETARICGRGNRAAFMDTSHRPLGRLLDRALKQMIAGRILKTGLFLKNKMKLILRYLYTLIKLIKLGENWLTLLKMSIWAETVSSIFPIELQHSFPLSHDSPWPVARPLSVPWWSEGSKITANPRG